MNNISVSFYCILIEFTMAFAKLSGVKEVASYIHRCCDPYKDNCKASEALGAWIAEEGYQPLE
ncbi:hypothetical protein [Paenibacillus vini]|uniref:Uncharacterized protein n=1 Tax=Paenibacillus vini TaxID=1476024 RepID=A0ABQ4M4V9_9BACL|nr:hypothetical protein [Paenibacillus vini]GIP51036.1 hypothetical protein J42TS3_00710 [Paenibacillus vini]